MKTILKDELGEVLFEGEAQVEKTKEGNRYVLYRPDFLFDLLVSPEGPILKTRETVETEIDFAAGKAVINTMYGPMETPAGLVALIEDDNQVVLVYWISEDSETHTLVLQKEHS